MKKRAVVLVSGGLDSAVTLYWAIKKGYACDCLTFDYGQRHSREIQNARTLASRSGAGLKIVRLDLPWKGSSLVDEAGFIPMDRSIKEIKKGIPSTYVPARNTIFLAIAASLAETIGAHAIFIGAHFEDSSGYPDCRASYLKAFNSVIGLGTKRGLQNRLSLEFPLIEKGKREIIEMGRRLGVPFELTWSCYKGGTRPCMRCDSCALRAKGFNEAGMEDPLMEKAYA